jgi:hypothetical protein
VPGGLSSLLLLLLLPLAPFREVRGLVVVLLLPLLVARGLVVQERLCCGQAAF